MPNVLVFRLKLAISLCAIVSLETNHTCWHLSRLTVRYWPNRARFLRFFSIAIPGGKHFVRGKWPEKCLRRAEPMEKSHRVCAVESARPNALRMYAVSLFLGLILCVIHGLQHVMDVSAYKTSDYLAWLSCVPSVESVFFCSVSFASAAFVFLRAIEQIGRINYGILTHFGRMCWPFCRHTVMWHSTGDYWFLSVHSIDRQHSGRSTTTATGDEKGKKKLETPGQRKYVLCGPLGSSAMARKFPQLQHSLVKSTIFTQNVTAHLQYEGGAFDRSKRSPFPVTTNLTCCTLPWTHAQ